MRCPIAALFVAFTLAACAPTPAETARAAQDAAADQARLATRLAGYTASAPQSCVDQFQLRNAQTASYGNTILYTVAGGLAYRSDTVGGCTDLGGNGRNILITSTPSTQLCQGDIATTVDSASHFQTGSCTFGPFVKYTKR